METEQIKQAVHAALDERDGIDRDTHGADHTWVRMKREREQRGELRRGELTDKIKATVIGGMALTLVMAAGTGLYNVGKFVIDLYQKSQSGH